MTAFRPISPSAALAMLEGSDVDARTLLADLAEAGIIKGYARLLKRGPVESRDCRIPRDVWSQIIAHQKVDDVFTQHSMRITPDGESASDQGIAALGIRFEEKSIAVAALQHGLLPPGLSAEPASAPTSMPDFAVAVEEAPATPLRAKPAPRLVPEGALQLTVDETMAALGIGRTTLYKLVGEGQLVMKKTGGRSHVTAQSIREFMDR